MDKRRKIKPRLFVLSYAALVLVPIAFGHAAVVMMEIVAMYPTVALWQMLTQVQGAEELLS